MQEQSKKIEMTNPEIINIIQGNEDKIEKSIFERAIIEAFKQVNACECIKKLSIALDEVKHLVDEVKQGNGSKYLLNKNLIDKLSRIIERKFFNVNILIAKIYDSLLETTNFSILSPNLDLLISFSNEILNLLDIVKSTNVAKSLEKKCSSFLNYLLTNSQSNLDDEQKDIIKELLNSFPNRNSSDAFLNFKSTRERIVALCKSTAIEDKLEGILLLMESFGDTNSLDEQFDLLLEHGPQIIKAAIHRPNPENRKLYYQLGNFIISLLYSYKYRIDSSNIKKENQIQKDQKSKLFFLVDSSLPEDSTSEKIKIQINDDVDLSFLNDSLYELTIQKDVLLQCENIVSICQLIVNTLSIYETIFELQYVCYLILKKIYFSFPQFKTQIEDLIALTLVNLCLFKTNEERVNTLECRQFLHYLLNCPAEEELKAKLKYRIDSKKANGINIQLEEGVSIDLASVEYDCLKFSDFNLRIGYPSRYFIEAGTQKDKYIEIEEPNSLVYIGFATHEYDITCHLLKYINDSDINSNTTLDDDLTDRGHFTVIFKLEKFDCSELPVKIVMLVCTPGIYKLIFDNSYSWFTSKTVRHRLSVLRPLSEIKFESQDLTSFNSNKQNEFHSNKNMLLKIEGKMRNYDFGAIEMKKQLILKEKLTAIYLPIIITKNSIRILNWIQDEHSSEKLTYEELLKDNETVTMELFEKTLLQYLLKIQCLDNTNNIQAVYLNVFVNEKTIANTETIIITQDETVKSSLNKIGFYPENLLKEYDKIKYSCNILADSCLLYNIFEKVIKDRTINSLIHIHFDKKGALASLYSEGVIHEKISYFTYDNSIDIMGNFDAIMEFVNKVIVLFGAFDLSCSYTNLDPKVFEQFCGLLKNKLEKLEIKVNFEQYDHQFIDNMLKDIVLFSVN